MKQWARKILSNPVLSDLENEIRAVDKLGLHGGHPNIVAVLRHGDLPSLESRIYFFDMELCHQSLEAYSLTLWAPFDLEERLHVLDPMNDPAIDPIPRMKYIWVIMKDIVNGLNYIHQHEEIHRDLKPSNSI